MPFDQLHHDILVMIFYIHIFVHLEPRYPLLLTCRSWYNVAINYSYLWKNISWAVDSTRDLKSLAQVLDRTGDYFDITLLANYDHKIDDFEQFLSNRGGSWLSRCRSLTISEYWGGSSRMDMPNLTRLLLQGGGFELLERLSWKQVPSGISWQALSELLGRIESSASGLRQLELKFSSQEHPVYQYGILLGRITHLRSTCEPTASIRWCYFSNLEHLEIDRNVPGHPPTDPYDSQLRLGELVAPRLRSLRLAGGFSPGDFFSQAILKRVTRIILFEFGTTVQNVFTSALPALTYLSVERQGRDAVNWIRAENLDEFHIIVDNYCRDSLFFFDATITPRVLRLSVMSYNFLHSQNLDQGETVIFGFHYQLPIWSQVQELHIVFFRGGRGLPPILVSALQGSEYEAPAFPALHCLTVQYSKHCIHDVLQREKQEKVDELLAIMENREEAGLPRFTRLEVGWQWVRAPYQLSTEGKFEPIVEDPENWTTEWRDCLQSA